jgi:hypothetical protein
MAARKAAIPMGIANAVGFSISMFTMFAFFAVGYAWGSKLATDGHITTGQLLAVSTRVHHLHVAD